MIAGFILQIILGGVYAWSRFAPSLEEHYGLTKGQCGLIFGVTIASFTISMIPAGRLLRKKGPRFTAAIGSIFFALGYLIASFSGGNFYIILTGIGILVGIGIGCGYVCPLTVTMKWFPNHKGLVTGIAVAGFGGGAIILGNLIGYLLEQHQWDVLTIFRFVALVMGSVAFVASLFLSEPEKTEEQPAMIPDNNIKHILVSWPFITLCIGIFAGTFAGLLIVGKLIPILIDLGLDKQKAAFGITVFAIGNALGRVAWGQINDKFPPKTAVMACLIFLALAIVPLALPINENLILLTVGAIGFGFGGCFIVYASSMVNYYGTELFPRLYPICFLGYGLAGIIAPAMGGQIHDKTDSFTVAIALSIAIVFVAIMFVSYGLPGKKFR